MTVAGLGFPFWIGILLLAPIESFVIAPPPDRGAAVGSLPIFPLGIETKTLDMERVSRPVREILRDLSAASEVQVTAAQSMAEEKLTVCVKAVSNREILSGVAAAVDGTWRARRRDGRVEYVLEASERRAQRAEAYRRQRVIAERRQVGLVLERLRSTLAGAEDTDPEAMANPPLFIRPVPIFPLFAALPPTVLERLVASPNPAFPSPGGYGPDSTPGVTLPVAWLPSAQRDIVVRFIESLAKEAAARGRNENLSQQFQVLAAHPELLHLDIWALRYETNTELGFQVSFSLLSEANGFQRDYYLVNSPRIPVSDPLDTPIQLGASGSRPEDPRELTTTADLLHGRASLDRALVEIARAARINLIADSYIRPGTLTLLRRGVSLRSLLAALEETYPVVHFWMSDVMIIRSRDWAAASPREPAADVLDRWDERKRDGGKLELEDYLYAARRLTQAQTSTMFNAADDHGSFSHRFETMLLSRHRHALRGYGALTALQRRKANQLAGLSFGNLTRAQLDAWGPVLDRFPLLPSSSRGLVRLVARPPTAQSGVIPALRLRILGLPEVPVVLERANAAYQ